MRVSTFSLSLNPPRPLRAAYFAGLDRLVVSWSEQLQPREIAAANWSGAVQLVKHLRVDGIPVATAAGNRTIVPCVRGAIEAGPDVCSYAAVPPDVTGITGVAAEPFANFPVTMYP